MMDGFEFDGDELFYIVDNKRVVKFLPEKGWNASDVTIPRLDDSYTGSDGVDLYLIVEGKVIAKYAPLPEGEWFYTAMKRTIFETVASANPTDVTTISYRD
jgi:hypothetical protein